MLSLISSGDRRIICYRLSLGREHALLDDYDEGQVVLATAGYILSDLE